MKLLNILVLILIFISCDKTPSTINSIVDDTNIEVKSSELSLSSIVKIKKIIPLETNSASLLGNIEKIMKRNNKYYIKSKNRSLAIFDLTGKYVNSIGSLGVGPDEYPALLDFDTDSEFIYILTTNKIQVYSQQGNFIKFIPLSLNVSGFRVVNDKILLFVLGDSYVVHLIDFEGKTIDKRLKRTQPLRLTKSIPFVRYGSDYFLFPQGHANNILAFNIIKERFENLKYLSSLNNMSAEEEANMNEPKLANNKGYSQNKRSFDGLTSSITQTIFGSIERDEVVLWVKDISQNQVNAYLFASLNDDLTFTSSDFLVKENTDGGDVFLSYLMPYSIAEGLGKNQMFSDNKNYKTLQLMLDSISVEESNPVIIEYVFK